MHGVRPASTTAGRAHEDVRLPAVKLTTYGKPSPRLGRSMARSQDPSAQADSDGASGEPSRDAPACSAAGPQLPAKRRGLDDLVAAVDVIEADAIRGPPLWRPLRSDWGHLLAPQQRGSRPVDTQPGGAPQAAWAAPPLRRLRRASAAEEAGGTSRTCYLLPAGTPVDCSEQYTVRECDISAEGQLGTALLTAAALDVSAPETGNALPAVEPLARTTSATEDVGTVAADDCGGTGSAAGSDRSEGLSLCKARGNDTQLPILELSVPDRLEPVTSAVEEARKLAEVAKVWARSILCGHDRCCLWEPSALVH